MFYKLRIKGYKNISVFGAKNPFCLIVEDGRKKAIFYFPDLDNPTNINEDVVQQFFEYFLYDSIDCYNITKQGPTKDRVQEMKKNLGWSEDYLESLHDNIVLTRIKLYRKKYKRLKTNL
jgi:hypothetical protein